MTFNKDVFGKLSLSITIEDNGVIYFECKDISKFAHDYKLYFPCPSVYLFIKDIDNPKPTLCEIWFIDKTIIQINELDHFSGFIQFKPTHILYTRNADPQRINQVMDQILKSGLLDTSEFRAKSHLWGMG